MVPIRDCCEMPCPHFSTASSRTHGTNTVVALAAPARSEKASAAERAAVVSDSPASAHRDSERFVVGHHQRNSVFFGLQLERFEYLANVSYPPTVKIEVKKLLVADLAAQGMPGRVTDRSVKSSSSAAQSIAASNRSRMGHSVRMRCGRSPRRSARRLGR